MLVNVSPAPVTEHAALDCYYREWGYHGGIAADDVVFVARNDSRPIGLVRRTVEHALTLLRGMYVAPDYRGQGVGQQLLTAFVQNCPAVDCYCLPFTHLTRFYERGGFRVTDERDTPPILSERLQQYRAAGHDVCVNVPRRSTSNL